MHALTLMYGYTNALLAGHGAQLHALVEALSYALADNRTLVLDDACPWSFKTGSSQRGPFWEVYFKPLSSCTLIDAAPSYTHHSHLPLPRPPTTPPTPTEGVDAGGGTRQRVVVWDSDTAVSGLKMPVGARGWGGISSGGGWTSRCLPPAAVRLGSTWWNGVVLSELVRPNEELERRVAEVGAAWVARGGTFRVGLHVRGGHKYIEMPPAPATKYVWQLRRLVAALFRLPFLEPVDERHEYTRARDRVLEWEGDGERGSAAGRGGRGERCRVHHVGVQGVQGGDNGRDGEVEFKGGPSEGGGVGVHGVGAFVATEDNDALEEIQRGAAEGGVHVMVVDEEHRRPNLRISVPMAVLHDVYVIYTHKHTPRKQELRARALSLSLCIFISICTHTHTHTHTRTQTHTHTHR